MGNSIGRILNNGMFSEALKSALTGALNSGDKRLVYVALLTAAASRAGNKTAFNLELEMNDLWTSLSNLRDSQSTQSGGRFGPMPALTAVDRAAIQSSTQLVVPHLNRILELLGKIK